MELINKDTPQVEEFISSLDSMLNGIETILGSFSGEALPYILHISENTLI